MQIDFLCDNSSVKRRRIVIIDGSLHCKNGALKYRSRLSNLHITGTIEKIENHVVGTDAVQNDLAVVVIPRTGNIEDEDVINAAVDR